MDIERLKQVDALLGQALELPEAERAAFVAAIEDEAIRQQLSQLLSLETTLETVLDQPVMESLLAEEQATAEIHARYGDFELLQRLGEGGMGQVWLARRVHGPVEQQVALKILHRGIASQWLRHKLLEEMRLLARLQHPGIVGFIDAGITDDDQPWLAMEYCPGQPVDRWCEAQALSTPRRIELIRQICTIVDYAHRQLVIHRDIKPGNILVDEQGNPRLLDFGIARGLELASENGEVDNPSTRAFSPGYAAPEQIRGGAISTATDVYALGVLACELLWGPLPIKELQPVEHWTELRAFLQQQLRDAPESKARNRQTTHKVLCSLTRSDLCRVLARALHPDPAARYATPRELAEDLANFQQLRPVQARPGNTRYRFTRFLQRHRTMVGVAGLAVLGMVLAFGVALYQWQQAEQAAAQARMEARRAESVGQFLTNLFAMSDPQQQGKRNLTLQEWIDRTLKQQLRQLPREPELRQAVKQSLAEVLVNLGRYQDAEPLIEDLLQQSLPVERKVKLLRTHANLLAYRGQTQQALDVLGQAEQLAGKLVDPLPRLATLVDMMGLWTVTLDEAREAQALDARLEPWIPYLENQPKGRALLVKLGEYRTVYLKVLGQYARALEENSKALALARQVYGDFHPRLATLYSARADVYAVTGQYAQAAKMDRQALAIHQETLGPDHADTLAAMAELGADLLSAGQPEKALSYLQQAIDGFRRLDEQNLNMMNMEGNLAEAARQLGQFAKAAQHLRKALEMAETRVGKESVNAGLYHALLGRALGLSGQARDAEKHFVRGLEILKKQAGEQSPYTLRILGEYGAFLLEQGRLDEAETALVQAVDGLASTMGPDALYVQSANLYLGLLRLRQGRTEEGQQRLRQALPVLEQAGIKFRRRVEQARQALKALAGTETDTGQQPGNAAAQ